MPQYNHTEKRDQRNCINVYSDYGSKEHCQGDRRHQHFFEKAEFPIPDDCDPLDHATEQDRHGNGAGKNKVLVTQATYSLHRGT